MTKAISDVSKRTPLHNIFAYSVGEGANCLMMNGIACFAMLYYTEALGLNYKLAAIALSVSVFWDAITDPFMGHISDNTRSRYGRRHPYMLIGGILAVFCYYFLWTVPEVFIKAHLLFWYLVIINLLLRTAVTVFLVPYGALGFEVCTDYDDRTTLQGVRFGFSMAVNLMGPALAWFIFFKDVGNIESTSIASNYVNMGTAFSAASVVFILAVVFTTRKYIIDTRNSKEIVGNNFRDFYNDMKEILFDRRSRIVFIFVAVVLVGIVIIGALQMYVYVYYMKFSSGQKAIVHGSTMVGAGLGALLSPFLARKLDKKPTVCIGVMLNVICCIALAAIFLTGFLPRFVVYNIPANVPLIAGIGIPVSMLCFMLFHSLYWAGNGILMPLTGSMMADLSEVNKYENGILKDGSYAAMLSFIFKAAISIGLLISGYCLDWIGFIAGSEQQTPEAIRNLAIVTFLGMIPVSCIALIAMLRYPITRDYMEKIKTALATKENIDKPIEFHKTVED